MSVNVNIEHKKYWQRKCRILIELDDGQVIDGLDEHSGLDLSNLRVQFSVSREIWNSKTDANITLYNLAPLTEKQILSQGKKLTIAAGYVNEEMYGQIFRGDIWQIVRGQDSPVDRTLKIHAMDARLLYDVLFVSILRGTNYRSCLEQIAQEKELEIGDIPEGWGEDQTLSRGVSFVGPIEDIINSLSDSTNSMITIEDNKIDVVNLDEPFKGEAYELNYKTGLIGFPQQTQEGIKVTTLLNPSIKPNSWFHLNNEDIIAAEVAFGGQVLQHKLDQDGLYRITAQTFKGDTWGNDWYIEHTCVSQAGAAPSFMIYSGVDGR